MTDSNQPEIAPRIDEGGEPMCSALGCPAYNDVGDYDCPCPRCDADTECREAGEDYTCIPAIRRQRDDALARLRETAQILIEAVGADGPMDAEDAAYRAVMMFQRSHRDADIALAHERTAKANVERLTAWSESAMVVLAEQAGKSHFDRLRAALAEKEQG